MEAPLSVMVSRNFRWAFWRNPKAEPVSPVRFGSWCEVYEPATKITRRMSALQYEIKHDMGLFRVIGRV